MRTTLLLMLVASVCLPLNVWAQQKPPAADDAHAYVAPLSYQSVFKDYLQYTDTNEPPDKVWVSANHEVQGHDSMGNMDMGGGAMKPDRTPDEPHGDHAMHSKGK